MTDFQAAPADSQPTPQRTRAQQETEEQSAYAKLLKFARKLADGAGVDWSGTPLEHDSLDEAIAGSGGALGSHNPVVTERAHSNSDPALAATVPPNSDYCDVCSTERSRHTPMSGPFEHAFVSAPLVPPSADSREPDTRAAEQLIAEAEALCAAATPGSWRMAGTDEKPWPTVTSFAPERGYQIHDMGRIKMSDPDVWRHMKDRYIADAAFIARARTLVPELVAALLAAAAGRVEKAIDSSDTARLDWLDAETMRQHDKETGERFYEISDAKQISGWSMSLRAAIDAATAASTVTPAHQPK